MNSLNHFRILSSIFVLTVIMAVLLCPVNTSAQANQSDSRNFGVGLMLGEPSGVSVKSWFNHKSAFDIGAAWSLTGRNEALHLHADYLRHSWFDKTDGLAFYYGFGARIIFSEDATAGVRVPLGLNYLFSSIPFDLFVEAVPILDISIDLELAGNGAVGIRYYF